MFWLIGGLFLGWSLGANDTANVFGTGVAARLIRYWHAVVFVAVFVIMGAVLEGPKCMETIGEMGEFSLIQAFYCTLSAALAMTLITIFAIPSSTSQAIVGAILGASLVFEPLSADQISLLIKMIICWVLTPVGSAVIAFLLYHIIDFIISRSIRITRNFQVFLQ
ncbi:inorganic phosphate transporter, partial [bacterium]|nr:inorganic phosphate transporter [candidate division CSSED10-310 bacterium]